MNELSTAPFPGVAVQPGELEPWWCNRIPLLDSVGLVLTLSRASLERAYLDGSTASWTKQARVSHNSLCA